MTDIGLQFEHGARGAKGDEMSRKKSVKTWNITVIKCAGGETIVSYHHSFREDELPEDYEEDGFSPRSLENVKRMAQCLLDERNELMVIAHEIDSNDRKVGWILSAGDIESKYLQRTHHWANCDDPWTEKQFDENEKLRKIIDKHNPPMEMLDDEDDDGYVDDDNSSVHEYNRHDHYPIREVQVSKFPRAMSSYQIRGKLLGKRRREFTWYVHGLFMRRDDDGYFEVVDREQFRR